MFSKSDGKSTSKLEFQDLNGDRFPDIVGQGVQFTRGTGVFESTSRTKVGLGAARSSVNETFQGGTGGSIACATANSRGNVAPSGDKGAPTASQGSDMPSLGYGGNVSKGTSETDYDLIDINGDGLPDKVWNDGWVSLNLGYVFADKEPWGGGAVNTGETLNGGISMSYNSNYYSMAGGMNLDTGLTWSNETYADINGDGLPDKVTPAASGNPMVVRLNTGAGFTLPISWGDRQEHSSGQAHLVRRRGLLHLRVHLLRGAHRYQSRHQSLSLHGTSWSMLSATWMATGIPELVHSENASELEAAGNPVDISSTNLLKTVKRPLGGQVRHGIRTQRQHLRDAPEPVGHEERSPHGRDRTAPTGQTTPTRTLTRTGIIENSTASVPSPRPRLPAPLSSAPSPRHSTPWSSGTIMISTSRGSC